MDGGRFMDLYQAVIIISFIFCVFLCAFALYFRRILDDAVHELDARLALALKATIEALPLGDIEPPNPLLQILAQHLGNQMNPAKAPNLELLRDESGKFQSAND